MKRKIFLWLLAFTVAVSGVCIARERSWWPLVFPKDQEELHSLINADAEKLIPLLGLPEEASFHQKTDAVRMFLYEHSVHQEDKEFYSYWYNMPLLLSMMATHAKEGGKKPHMECASRSAAMYHMLEVMGIRARMVVIRPAKDVLLSHTLLEVFNPETSRWEVQDPDRNLYWTFNDTGKRAGIEDLLHYKLPQSFAPCRAPDDCGYRPEDRTPEFLSKFAFASVMDFDAGKNVLLVNKSRFGLDHPFLNLTPQRFAYCELFGAECRKKIVAIDDAPVIVR